MGNSPQGVITLSHLIFRKTLRAVRAGVHLVLSPFLVRKHTQRRHWREGTPGCQPHAVLSLTARPLGGGHGGFPDSWGAASGLAAA